jgi:outer membrane lipoprotein LolB
LRRARIAALAMLLAGCAGLGTQETAPTSTELSSAGALQRFTLEGRVSVRAEDRQYSGGLTWERRLPVERLLLTTPMGQGVAEILREADRLVLIDAEGRRQEAADADALARQALGAPIPLSGLVYWLSAKPRPGSAHRATLDAEGRVRQLEQDGWRIEYDRYRADGVPGRLFARLGEDVEFRLVVDRLEMP